MEWMPLALVITVFAILLLGYPVAFTLGGVSLLFAMGGHLIDIFPLATLHALPANIYGVMTSDILIAVPLFVFMGIVLEQSRIAEELLTTMASLFGQRKAGLSVSVLLVGGMLAASTGIVGATVVTMGLISLPVMMKHGYCPKLATGTICASGTLGQIIPPSIVLILLADQISSAWQITQLNAGVASPVPVSIADMFVAALIPGGLLILAYICWQYLYGLRHPNKVPPIHQASALTVQRIMVTLVPPFALIALVLGSILAGIATATESAAIGALGALILAACRRTLTINCLKCVVDGTLQMSCMVFMILIGATIFTLVFRGYQGDVLVQEMLTTLPGGLPGAMLVTMLIMFCLGFFLDFIQIIYVVVPIVAPILLSLGADPVWLAIMMAINLQTSFLTPPFGFSLFYLRGVAPDSIQTSDIYRGVLPFIVMQLLMLGALSALPALATWLPRHIYGSDFQLPVNAATTLRNHFNDNAESWEINF